MKKRIISILLVMVTLLTMTACVAKTDEQNTTTAPTIITTVQSTTEETSATINDRKVEVGVGNWVYESELRVKYLRRDDVKEMDSKEISDFLAEMVRISEGGMSILDMYQMGDNFSNLSNWKYWNYIDDSSFEQEEYEAQAYAAFGNVYELVCSCKIPLDEIYSWEYVPVADVLCKYFSSCNFYRPEDVNGSILIALTEEDVNRVAEAFFDNPVMATNSSVPTAIINCGFDNHTTDMAWEHLTALSKSDSARIPEFDATYDICSDILMTIYTYNTDDANIQNIEKIEGIAKNILENPNYDISEKYSCFCNAYHNEMNDTYTDQTISNMAYEHLFDLARNADEETAEQIKNCFLDDTDAANELLNILESNC